LDFGPALLAGELAKPGPPIRIGSAWSSTCKRIARAGTLCVEHAHRVVTVPFLKAAAEEFGIHCA
jgi:hypothetical protein